MPVLSPPLGRPLRAFSLVEIMIAVVIIGLLTALALPTYRRITMRAKATAVVNDLRAFSTAFITYNLQNGQWPADEAARVIPAEMTGSLGASFELKSPIGGYYKWCAGASADGIDANAALIIESDMSNPLSDDEDLRLLIDQQLDDGDLHTGLIQVGSTNSLVFIIEPSEGVMPLPPPAMSALPRRNFNLRVGRANHARLPLGLIIIQ
ncbi:MAG: prepilin-type N-terminal cleavage/methylation domain-containing protein [Opitutaceae bacterium]